MLKELIYKLGASLPPAVSARFFYATNHKSYFYPWGTAMNGQTARLEATRQIFFKCGIQQIVETGTFRGTTTEWFAGFGIPVVTVEFVEQSYEFAKIRLRQARHVRIERGESVATLKVLTAELNLSVPTFFYLDAHWEGHLPLREELEVIAGAFKAAVILIDDYEVPEDAGYTFDDYGPGKVLNEEYLRTCGYTGAKIFYPSVPAEQETGSKRGWVVLTNHAELSERLSEIELLRAVVLK